MPEFMLLGLTLVLLAGGWVRHALHLRNELRKERDHTEIVRAQRHDWESEARRLKGQAAILQTRLNEALGETTAADEWRPAYGGQIVASDERILKAAELPALEDKPDAEEDTDPGGGPRIDCFRDRAGKHRWRYWISSDIVASSSQGYAEPADRDDNLCKVMTGMLRYDPDVGLVLVRATGQRVPVRTSLG